MDANKIDADKIPHLSADEHSLLALEEQLLKDGRQWLSRAAELYTQTSKIKIWVPVVGSMLITSYYLYAIHVRTVSPAAMAAPAAQSAPVVVADETPQPKIGSASLARPDGSVESLTPDFTASTGSDLLKQARRARAEREFADEAGLLQKLADRPDSPQLVCPELGKAYEQAGQLDASIKAFERCAASQPGNVDTMLAFAHALQTNSEFKRALAIYRQCMLKDPANLDAPAGLALLELKQNHLREANETALSVLTKAPANTDALLITGIVAWRQARLPDAERIFQKGVDLDDHRADFHAFLGRVAEAQGRPQDALQQYERTLALDPSDLDIADRRDRLKELK